MAKLPVQPDPGWLEDLQPETCTVAPGEPVARIYFGESPYGSTWNGFRFYDNKQLTKGHRGIMYLSSGHDAFKTCIAEVFQKHRVIDTVRQSPTIVTFELKREVLLLNLRGSFATRIGASSAINTGSRTSASSWARALYERYEEIDGLAYCLSMNGLAPAVALFERAIDAIPDTPLTHRRLSDHLLHDALSVSAQYLGYLLKDQ